MHPHERGLGALDALTPAHTVSEWLGVDDGALDEVPAWVVDAIAARLQRDPEATIREELLGRVRDAMSTLNHVARTDTLTGLANRRAVDEKLAEELHRAHRYGRELAVFLLDVDGLKRVNDEHGHLAGDALVCEVARRLDAAVRLTDLAGRWGGDEFAVVCPETNNAGAAALALKLHAALTERPMRVGDRILPVRVSIGWAVDGSRGDVVALIAAADAALYAAKARRRRQGA
ncbi:MAG: GGDEF domain-containing protein [Candidatus Dormibacteria bacterium]